MAKFDQQQTELLKIFERRLPNGCFYYSDRDVRHFLPVMALSTKIDLDKHPSLKKVMDELVAKLALPDGASSTATATAIKDYYRKNPVNAELMSEYRAYCRKQKQAQVAA